MATITVAVGSDHGAVALKDEVKRVLAAMAGVTVTDVGTFGADAVDYPDIAEKLCAELTSGRAALGIVMCGTGIGVSIAANKVRGIRCALCGDVFSAKMARAHNDANVLALGGRVLGVGLAGEIVRAFMSGQRDPSERHARRVAKLMALER